MASSQSQGLNLQHGDQVLHSLLQEWIAKQTKVVETTDQTDLKAFPDLDDGTPRTRPSYFSPSVPEPSVDSPSGTSPESSIDPNQRANIQGVGGRPSVGRRTFRTVVSGLIIAVAVGAGWQVYRGDQTKELLKTWGHSSLIWISAVLGTSQRGLELATEPVGYYRPIPARSTSFCIRGSSTMMLIVGLIGRLFMRTRTSSRASRQSFARC